MDGKEGCYKYGDIGYKMRDCQVASSKERNSERARCKGGTSQPKPGGGFIASTIFKYSNYGKNHKRECLAGLDTCYRCGKLGHHVKECRSGIRPLDLAQTTCCPDQSATTSDGGQR
ncbi:cold shock protein 1-like [Solanum dulcamara]|uniref:cold shock protein 1-like n=1 Tax=Solanum dulcamara TaxID=45834 RepID=UPI00248507F1|nr:cold shock protein 1-like [Solanum dulcamara]